MLVLCLQNELNLCVADRRLFTPFFKHHFYIFFSFVERAQISSINTKIFSMLFSDLNIARFGFKF